MTLLNAATGAVLWTVGPCYVMVDASPAVANGAVGPSGAGKTTTSMIAVLLDRDRGKISTPPLDNHG